MSALQQTRGQLLKVSEQISVSLRSSQEQLEEARADAAELHTQLRSTQQLLQHANETLLVKVRTRNLSIAHPIRSDPIDQGVEPVTVSTSMKTDK